jgi:hypothetical protein
MSAEPAMMISTGVTTATSEVDIAMHPTNVCIVVAAANDATLGVQKIFRSSNWGETWDTSVLPLFPDDRFHRHPSLGWTSDGRIWAINMGTPSSTSPFSAGLTFLRCYFSDNFGGTWSLDHDFRVDQTTIQSLRMCVDYTNTDLRDTIYVIWGSDNSVFVKYREPQTGTWRPTIQLDSQSIGPVSGCEIKSDPVSGNVIAFWHDTGSGNLYASVSATNDAQNGPTFGPRRFVANATASPGISIPSCISNKAAISISCVYSGLIVYFVWADLTEDGTKTRIWFSYANAQQGNLFNIIDKKMINDAQSLNDQFHPRIWMDGYSNRLAVVYYDTIGDPTRRQTGVWLQTASNFTDWTSPPSPVTMAPTDETAAGANQFQYGDYIGLTGGARGFLFAAWTDRSSGVAEQIWARRVRIPPIPEPCSDPILTSAAITFNTTTDDKDDNTTLDVNVLSVYGWEIAASASGAYGVFHDHSSHQVPLQLSQSLVSRSRLQDGRVTVLITPQGLLDHDIWNFNFGLDFTFTNGTSMHIENPVTSMNPHISLNQDDNMMTFFINSGNYTVTHYPP